MSKRGKHSKAYAGSSSPMLGTAAAWLAEHGLAEHSSSKAGSWSWSGCDHRAVPYLLPNGATVYASGHHDIGHRTPDFGYYLDGIWRPKTIAFHIGWKDYGLPSLPFHQMSLLVSMAIEQAKGGATVEIGCIGGHGRTGTFLSLLTLETMELSEHATPYVAARYAIARVRSEYCDKAVESEGQEDYIWEYARRLMA